MKDNGGYTSIKVNKFVKSPLPQNVLQHPFLDKLNY